MTYQVTYTETTNPLKPPISVQDQTLNQQTSVSFVGKNYAGYAPVIAENFLHLLENFACPDSGSNTPSSALLNSPVQGQLWYNTTSNILNVYDGTSWSAAGNIKKSTSAPQDGAAGDLWVDTDTKQLYLYSGSNWLLIGPQFSAGTQTGPAVETLSDTNDVDHNVLSVYANNNRIVIVSKESFTPKQTIAGFTTIGQGVNLSSVDAGSSTSPTKFWGTASVADALNVNSAPISASNFLRSDQTSTTNFSFNIRNNNGLTVGADLSFNLSTSSSATVLYNKTSGASVDFRLNNNGDVNTVLHVDARNRIGVGPSNTNPQATLDVLGDILSSGPIAVTDTTDSTSVGVGSIATAGGLSVEKNLNVGKDVSVFGKIYVNNLDSNDTPIGGSVILPGSDSASILYDIGSSTRRFRNVYAQTFQGNFSGTFSGPLSGSITGSAAKLASPTVFSLTGDVTSNAISFDGQTSNGTATFTTEVSQDFVASKTEVTDSLNSDQLLIYRQGTGLRKITKETFVSNIPTMPIGAVLPYAGQTAPAGYLLCDGSEVPLGTYSALFQVIGYSYKPAVLLLGKNTFALPDMRGRFPLGRDNMDNNITVPDKTDQNIFIDAGGGAANRVTDVTADTLGAGSGSDTKTLDISNIPEHRHTLSTGQADYFAVGRPGLTSDPNGVSPPGPQSTSAGLAVPNTGGVLTSQTGQPINVMNPYQTINYIIYTGVLV
jgi:microcystin-dependent protein